MADSDTTDQPKRRGRKPRIRVTPRTDDIGLDAIVDDINQRRLSGERVRNRGLIPLREPGRWALHQANTLVNDARHYTMVHEAGWLPVTIDDLKPGTTPQSVGYRLAEDGRTLCKGPRGDEVLYKKERSVHEAIKLREAKANLKPTQSESAAKADIANAAAAAHGAQAGEYIASNTTVRVVDREGPLGSA